MMNAKEACEWLVAIEAADCPGSYANDNSPACVVGWFCAGRGMSVQELYDADYHQTLPDEMAHAVGADAGVAETCQLVFDDDESSTAMKQREMRDLIAVHVETG